MGMEVASPELGFQWENDDSTLYASAPSSPIRISFSGLPCSYSAPSSPTRGLATFTSWEADLDDMSRRAKINNDTIDFEFETSRTFERCLDLQQQQQKKVEGSPTMAYADQLFKNGKVLPSTPTATPPPQLQIASNRSLSLPAPRSSTLAQHADFFELCFKQKDVERFGVGRDYAGREKMEKVSEIGYRRAQSHAVARTYSLDEEISRGLHHRHKERRSSPPSTQGFTMPERSAAASDHEVAMRGERGMGPMVEMDGPSLKAANSLRESSKTRRIKNLFLFRSASHGRAQPKDKLREHTAAIWKTEAAVNSGIEPYSHETQCKEKKKEKKKKKKEKKVKEKKEKAKEKEKEKVKEKEKKPVKKTAVQSRPVLLLCMGYSSKAMKQIN